MDGIPAQSLWDLVIAAPHSVRNRTDGPKREPWLHPSADVKPNTHNSIQIKHTSVIPTNIDHIPSNTTHSDSSAMLYVFEDNEAVIKTIIKGHHLHISPNTSNLTEAVFFMVRKIYGKQLGDLMKGWDMNLAVWWMFVDSTLRAAVHLGKDCDANLRYAMNHLWKTTGELFRETERLMSGQTGTTSISLINFQDLR